MLPEGSGQLRTSVILDELLSHTSVPTLCHQYILLIFLYNLCQVTTFLSIIFLERSFYDICHERQTLIEDRQAWHTSCVALSKLLSPSWSQSLQLKNGDINAFLRGM